MSFDLFMRRVRLNHVFINSNKYRSVTLILFSLELLGRSRCRSLDDDMRSRQQHRHGCDDGKQREHEQAKPENILCLPKRFSLVPSYLVIVGWPVNTTNNITSKTLPPSFI